MIIEKIEIESYAAIKGLCIDLTDGVNLIEGSNESGKSSIADFIKFVLYGVSGKGSDGHLSERKRAINFLDSHAGGSLCVRVGDKRYRITRNTAVSGTVRESVRTKFSLRDIDSGADVSDGREPGEQLLGIPESVFVRSAYLRQGGESELQGGDIHDAISNILFSGDERLSVEKAIERIDNARIPLSHKHGNKGRIYELQGEIAELTEAHKVSLEANEQILALSFGVNEKKNKYNEQISKYESLKSQARAYECATALESFEKLSLAEAEKVAAEMAMLEFKGVAHIPTEEEMDELHAYEISINTMQSQLADTEEQKQRIEEEAGKLNISKKLKEEVERHGNGEAVLSMAMRAQRSGGRAMLFSVLSLLLGAVCGGVAFALAPLLVPFLIAASVLACLSVVFVIVSFSSKKKLRLLCSECDCKTLDELETALSSYERSKLRMAVLEEKLMENSKREAECKSLVAAERARLREFLLDLDIEDNVESMTSIDKISETLKARIRKCAELETAANTTRAYYDGLLSKTEQQDEQKLRDELSSLNVEDPLLCDIEKTKKNMLFYKEQSALLSEKIHEQELELAHLRATLTPPSAIRERLSECADELERSQKKLDAYVLAADSLRAAAEELRRGVAPALAQAAGDYMSTLTDGKYGALVIDPSFALSYEAYGEPRHIDYMSCGTQDMAYLCLRLSLADIISKQSALPIILDEATAHLDDKRAKGLLSLLQLRSADRLQHILFTCHGREAGLLSEMGGEYNYIKL